jgi:hypothetical protein
MTSIIIIIIIVIKIHKTDQTVRKNRPDRFVLNKTLKEAYLIGEVIYNRNKLYSTVTEKLQNYN